MLADSTVETHTECVADGQTALEFGVVYGYLHIHKHAWSSCLSLCLPGKMGDKAS